MYFPGRSAVTARNLLIRKIQISWLGDSFFLIRKSHTGGRKIVFPKEIEFSQQENRVFLASFGAKLAQAAVLGGGVSCAEESAKVPRMGTQWYSAESTFALEICYLRERSLPRSTHSCWSA